MNKKHSLFGALLALFLFFSPLAPANSGFASQLEESDFESTELTELLGDEELLSTEDETQNPVAEDEELEVGEEEPAVESEPEAEGETESEGEESEPGTDEDPAELTEEEVETPGNGSEESESPATADDLSLMGSFVLTDHADFDPANATFKVNGSSSLIVDVSAFEEEAKFGETQIIKVSVPEGLELGSSLDEQLEALAEYWFENDSPIEVLEIANYSGGTQEIQGMVNVDHITSTTHNIFAVLVQPVGSGNNLSRHNAAAVTEAINHANSYWTQQSGGKVKFKLQGIIANYTSSYNCIPDGQTNQLWYEAQQKAVAQLGYKAGKPNQHLALFFPAGTNCGGSIGLANVGWTANYGGNSWTIDTNSLIGKATLTHELGHNLSLGHSNALLWKTTEGNPRFNSAGNPVNSSGVALNRTAAAQGYWDIYDVMGFGMENSNGGNLSAPHAIRSGMWTSSAYYTATQGKKTYSISPISTHKGRRAIVVEDPLTGVQYFVEYRDFKGRDAQLTANKGYYTIPNNNSGGVRIMVLEEALADYRPNGHRNASWVKGRTGNESYVISRNWNGTNGNGINAIYTSGQQFESRSGGVRIKVVSTNSKTAKIEVYKPSSSPQLSSYYYAIDEKGVELSTNYSYPVGTVMSIDIPAQSRADSYSFQWYRGKNSSQCYTDSKSKLKNGTGQSYTVSSSDVNKRICVKVTAKTGSKSKSILAGVWGPFYKGTLESSASVSVEHSGTSLKANIGNGWITPSTTIKYQWYRDGKAISKATKSSYKPTSSDRNKNLYVKVTGSRSGFNSVSRSSTAQKYNLVRSGSIAINGTPQVGQTLTISDSTIFSYAGGGTAPVTKKYQWYRDGKAISGATSTSYKLASSDYNKQITVRVTGSYLAYYPDSATSAKTAKVARGVIAGNPVVSITETSATLNKAVLKANVSGITETGVSYKYQWYADNKAIKKATKSSYTVSSSYKSKKIRVKVTVSKSNYASKTANSADTVRNIAANTDLLAASRVVKIQAAGSNPWDIAVGSQLSAVLPSSFKRGGVSVSSASFSYKYQWYRDGKTIKNATGNTYTPSSSDRGKSITVKIWIRSAGFFDYTQTSKGTQKLGNDAFFSKFFTQAPLVSYSKSGTHDVLLSAENYLPPGSTGVSNKYQWYRDGKAIKNATKQTLKLTTSDAGKNIYVRITQSKSGNTPVVSNSAQRKYSFTTEPALKISGSIKVGKTIQVDPVNFYYVNSYGAKVVYLNYSTSDVTFRWYRDGKAISGANSYQYKLTSKDKGKRITAKLTLKASELPVITTTFTTAKTAKVK